MPRRRRGRLMMRRPCNRTGRRRRCRCVARRLFAPDMAGMNGRRLVMGRFGLAPYDRRSGMMAAAAGRLGVSPFREAKRGESQNTKNEFLHCLPLHFSFPGAAWRRLSFLFVTPPAGCVPPTRGIRCGKGVFPKEFRKKRKIFWGPGGRRKETQKETGQTARSSGLAVCPVLSPGTVTSACPSCAPDRRSADDRQR